ncbi:lysozyme [Undibacterium sp. MH2W]|uniref:lysozyme n=1 Tax=Undibacterium sp. MH2W TaxID=3413044 RepID=UPI003BF1FA8C
MTIKQVRKLIIGSRGATVGYGKLISEEEWPLYKDGVTQEQADRMFNSKLNPVQSDVQTRVTAKVTQYEFDALVIFDYNIGSPAFQTSSALKLVNNPNATTNYSSLEDAWKAFTKSQGKENKGLIHRRDSEWDIYSNNVYKGW